MQLFTHVLSSAGSIQSKPDNFFANFDAVILGRSSVSLKVCSFTRLSTST